MNINTIQTGFIDLPNTTTVNIFTQGCYLGCPECSNPQLQPITDGSSVSKEDFIKRLSERSSISSWVCWLGGEPTIHDDLPEYMKIAQDLSFHNALFTGHHIEDDQVQRILKYAHIIIDGPWKGIPITDKETNQRIFIKDRRNPPHFRRIKDWDQLTVYI